MNNYKPPSSQWQRGTIATGTDCTFLRHFCHPTHCYSVYRFSSNEGGMYCESVVMSWIRSSYRRGYFFSLVFWQISGVCRFPAGILTVVRGLQFPRAYHWEAWSRVIGGIDTELVEHCCCWPMKRWSEPPIQQTNLPWAKQGGLLKASSKILSSRK